MSQTLLQNIALHIEMLNTSGHTNRTEDVVGPLERCHSPQSNIVIFSQHIIALQQNNNNKFLS